MTDTKINISGLLISSGFSSRMGELKPLLEFEGLPFLVQIIKKMSTVCDKIVIVLGHEAESIESIVKKYLVDLKLADRTNFVFNKNFEKGMFTSLQCGLGHLQNSDWILYHFADQPGLPEQFYKDFSLQIENEVNWIQPIIKGRKGHPILLGSQIFKTILKHPQNGNLREVIASSNLRKKLWECGYAEIFQDIDTMEDYKSLLNKNEK